jgi:hypothetical protein
MSNKTVPALENDPAVIKYLRNVPLRPLVEVLKDIGFLLSYVPTKDSKEYVKIKLSGKQQPLKTHTFSVQVQSKDAPAMNQFLRKVYEDKKFFVPYLMQKNPRKQLQGCIKKQNKRIKDTWVVVLIVLLKK